MLLAWIFMYTFSRFILCGKIKRLKIHNEKKEEKIIKHEITIFIFIKQFLLLYFVVSEGGGRLKCERKIF